MKKTIVRIVMTALFLISLASTTALADGSTPEPCIPGPNCTLN
jgi:hypothetical protein